jgi:hypothetical protein
VSEISGIQWIFSADGGRRDAIEHLMENGHVFSTIDDLVGLVFTIRWIALIMLLAHQSDVMVRRNLAVCPPHAQGRDIICPSSPFAMYKSLCFCIYAPCML